MPCPPRARAALIAHHSILTGSARAVSRLCRRKNRASHPRNQASPARNSGKAEPGVSSGGDHWHSCAARAASRSIRAFPDGDDRQPRARRPTLPNPSLLCRQIFETSLSPQPHFSLWKRFAESVPSRYKKCDYRCFGICGAGSGSRGRSSFRSATCNRMLAVITEACFKSFSIRAAPRSRLL